MKKNIIIFAPFYEPGFIAGGPIKSISNIVDGLNSEYKFYIFTRANDLNSRQNYKGIKLNKWNQHNNSDVFYSNSLIFRFFSLLRLLNNKNIEFIYLNSLYSFHFSIIIVLINFFFGRKILLAPRGELSPGAQFINKRKKIFFNFIINYSSLYRNCLWHVTSEYEKVDVLSVLKVDVNKIFIANNIPSKVPLNKPKFVLNTNSLNLVFYSRISPKKNLVFILKCLSKLKSKVVFDIYGPIEDLKYWNICELEILKLPIHISVNYKGVVTPNNLGVTLINYDLFVFPTFGENFGHVIYESLISGLPVLVSKSTPWCDKNYNIITTLDLDLNIWTQELNIWASFSKGQIMSIKKSTYKYALGLNLNKKSIDETIHLFHKISII